MKPRFQIINTKADATSALEKKAGRKSIVQSPGFNIKSNIFKPGGSIEKFAWWFVPIAAAGLFGAVLFDSYSRSVSPKKPEMPPIELPEQFTQPALKSEERTRSRKQEVKPEKLDGSNHSALKVPATIGSLSDFLTISSGLARLTGKHTIQLPV